MKKQILLSIIFGLSLSAATPAQAWNWYNPLSWFKSQPAAQVRDVEAARHIAIPAPASRSGWFSYVRNPIAAFSAWWNKASIERESQLRAALEAEQQSREKLKNRLTDADATEKNLQDIAQSRADRIDQLHKENTELEEQKKQAEAEAKNEKALLAEQVKKAHSEVEQEKNKTTETEASFIKIAAEQILKNREADQKTIAELRTEKRIQKEHNNAKEKRLLDSVQCMAEEFNSKMNKFQGQANSKLDRLDQRILRITQATKERKEPSLAIANVRGQLESKERGENPAINLVTSTQQNPLLSSLDFTKMEPAKLAIDLNAEYDHDKQPLEYSEQQTELGHRYARKLITGVGDEIPTETQEEYLKSIIALKWFFYDYARKNGAAFEEGTFTIEDRDSKIYNFLMDYVKRVNPDIKGDISDPLTHCSYNPWGYRRKSSHFIKSKELYGDYGIDMRLPIRSADLVSSQQDRMSSQFSGELQLLPAQKRHILFGKINEKYIYVKPENYGLYYADGFLAHAGEFFTAQARKSPAMRSLLGVLGWNIGTDDDANNRKERVPARFVQEFTNAMKANDKLNKQKQDMLKQVKTEGFQLLAHPELQQSPEMQQLLQKYTEEFGSVEGRFGNEVQITWNNLLTFIGGQQ